MADGSFFSPAEVAEVLGVSASTIKRWVDQGVLRAHKTIGGHRKLLRADVLRLVREGSFPCLDGGRLNLPGDGCRDASLLSDRLFDSLMQGDGAIVRSILHGAYAAGMAIETLGDQVIAPAMARIGHQWEEGRIDVMHEHRGTVLCAAALHELRPSLEIRADCDRPTAVGGAAEGDSSVLPTLLIQLMLLDLGWDAVNLGPDTPLTALGVAMREMRPKLVWLSASYLTNEAAFISEYCHFHSQALRDAVPIAVGGRALQAVRSVIPATFFGESLTDLATFARTLHPRPQPPKRGRPCAE